MHIVIAGGGVAGLEALLALRALAGDRARLTMVAPDPVFTYKPLAVAQPFAAGSMLRVALSRFAEDVGALLVDDAVVGVDDDAGELRLRDGGVLAFDQAVIATGAIPSPGLAGATTWWPGGNADVYGGLLRDLEEGYVKQLTVVVPPGAAWALPAYELALMTAGEAAGMGQEIDVRVVAPEPAPLTLFGERASHAVERELAGANVRFVSGRAARVEAGAVVMESGDRLEGQRVVAIPRLTGPGLSGLPADADGFILAGGDTLVRGCARTWAAGDGVQSPVKFGGLATHQARTAAAGIARLMGVEGVADPGEPVLHGRLMVGRGMRRLPGRGDGEAAPLWWPGSKVAGEYLPRWLAAHAAGVDHPEPPSGGLTVRRPLRAMRALEEEYLHARPDVGALADPRPAV